MSDQIPAEDLAAFHGHLIALEQQHGVELSDEQRQEIAQQSASQGFTPDTTLEAFGALVERDYEPAAEEFGYDQEYEYEQQPELDPSEDVYVQRAEADIESFAAKQGRPLLQRELEGIGHGIIYRGQTAEDAFNDYYAAQGKEPLDLDTNAGRTAFATERLQEARALREEGQEQKPIDMDTHEGRVAYAMHRLNGGEVEYVDAEPNGTDPEETTE